MKGLEKRKREKCLPAKKRIIYEGANPIKLSWETWIFEFACKAILEELILLQWSLSQTHNSASSDQYSDSKIVWIFLDFDKWGRMMCENSEHYQLSGSLAKPNLFMLQLTYATAKSRIFPTHYTYTPDQLEPLTFCESKIVMTVIFTYLFKYKTTAYQKRKPHLSSFLVKCKCNNGYWYIFLSKLL